MKRYGLVPRLVILFLSVGAFVGLGTSTANASGGGVDVQGYCATEYAGAYGKAVTVGSGAYDWRCEVRWNIAYTERLGVDMNRACQRQYGNSSSAYLVNNNSGSLYNWRCR